MTEGVNWHASWIWKPCDSYTAYNQAIEARKTLDLPPLEKATLRITADTRYRLFVNGRWINDGPARSWPHQYQYDLIDVTSYLTPGVNTIEVVAMFYGIGTFHQIPQEAGLLAQLDVVTPSGERQCYGTDASWEVRDLSGWVRSTPKQSVQMGPFEIYDAREPESAFMPALVRYQANEGPWKNLQPRDCPLLTYKEVCFAAPVAMHVTKRLPVETFIFPTVTWLYDDVVFSNHHVTTLGAFATLIEMPESGGEVRIDADGHTVFIEGKRARNNEFMLGGGRHLLYCVLSDGWGHWRHDTQICIWSEAKLRLINPLDAHAESPWCFIPPAASALHRWSDYQWALLPASEREPIEQTVHTAIRELSTLRLNASTAINVLSGKAQGVGIHDYSPAPHYLFKAKEVVAELPIPVPEGTGQGDSPFPLRIDPSLDGDTELVFDLGEQNVGYYSFVIHGEAGLMVDLFGVEYISPSGAVQHTERYRNGMRYICREGENRFTSYRRRSQRYLFLTLRNQTKPAVLEHLSLIESTYPVNPIGSFRCSSAALTRIWEISARTLKLCMEDVFTDCPLYEQTLWVGDARNEALFAYTAFGAFDIAKRCLRLAAYSLDRHPLVQCQVPSTWETLLPAWSFLWNIMIWDYYQFTGDKEFLAQIHPYAMKNLRNAAAFSDSRGLFSAPFWNMFDWSGIDDGHATVVHNSMFAVGAVDAAIKTAEVLEEAEDVLWLQAYRNRLVEGINGLWRDDVAMYPDAVRKDGSSSDRISIHNAFLALLYHVAPEAKKESLLHHILNPPKGMTPLGSPFAMLYLFEALEQLGLQEEIVSRIEAAYQPMLELNSTTVWETFAGALNYKGEFPTRSHTHAWSSSPIYFLNRIILGIVPEAVGGTAVRISPYRCGLSYAEGATATLQGPVHVSWKHHGNQIDIRATAPESVRLRFVRNKSLEDLTVTFNGTLCD